MGSGKWALLNAAALAISRRPPTTHYPLPTTHYPLPTPHFLLPIPQKADNPAFAALSGTAAEDSK